MLPLPGPDLMVRWFYQKHQSGPIFSLSWYEGDRISWRFNEITVSSQG